MKEFAFLVLITALVTNAQLPASLESKSDAERIASARKLVQSLLRKTQRCSTIQLRQVASSGFSGLAPMDGLVFRVSWNYPR
jgi:hypothetical protein